MLPSLDTPLEELSRPSGLLTEARRPLAPEGSEVNATIQLMIVLGDGAPWIWNLAAEHFPGAIEIVDLYHAREHLTGIAKVVYGPEGPEAKQWADARIAAERLSPTSMTHTLGGFPWSRSILYDFGRERAMTYRDEFIKDTVTHDETVPTSGASSSPGRARQQW